ncbi:MAG: hypothetical protein GX755_07955, partial [Syntrophomonadaceae bacterium]|nr:hypothetical protein [Syntrophomonadaceae bacterium]
VEAGTAFASIEQLTDLYRTSASIKEVEGRLTASVQLGDKSIDFHEGSKQAAVNNQEYELVQVPYRLDDSNCVFWIPLSDWAKLTDSQVQWIDGNQPLIVLTMPTVYEWPSRPTE